MSEACKLILDKIGGYVIQERGLINIKVTDWWLIRTEKNKVLTLVILLGQGRDEVVLVVGQAKWSDQRLRVERYGSDTTVS